jgi:16S rRNA (uracil1498-N3)-methyltransferase
MDGDLWFLAPPGDWHDDRVLLSTEETHHALHVLRISPAEVVSVFDGQGAVARGSAGSVSEGRMSVQITERTDRKRRQPHIVLYQAAAKGSKLDEIVQRAAELGVAELCVFGSTRTVVRWEDAKRIKLVDRWNSIAVAAAKQSRDPFVMRTGPAVSWTEMIGRIEGEPLAVTLWEEATRGLRGVLPADAERVAVVVGPEGGFTREEAESLAATGAAPVSLGPRIFRTEMAPLVAVCSLLWHYGLIG